MNGLSQLPPPPTGQKGMTLDQLGAPPAGQKGQTLQQIIAAQSQSPQSSPTGGTAGGINETIGSVIPGLSGTAKAIGGAAALPFVTSKAQDATKKANDLVTQAMKLPVGDPKRSELLHQSMAMSQNTSAQLTGALNETPTVKSAAGSMAKLALTAGTAELTPAVNALGKIGQGAAIGGGFGAAQGVEGGKSVGDVAKSGLTGALIGGATAGLFEAGKWAVGKIPKLLSYASDTPEAVLQRNYDNPEAMKEASDYLSKNGPSAVLNDTQDAVKTLRANLTQQYQEGKDAVIALNQGKRAIFDSKTQNLLTKAADAFSIDLPQNMDNVSVNEAINLNEEINSVLSEGNLQATPEGVVLRKASDALGNVIKGEGAKFQGVGELLSNYSGEKKTLDAADMLVKAYRTSNPIDQRTALSRLLSVYNENAPSFFSAMKDLEQKTGIPIMDKLAALKSSTMNPASGVMKSETWVSAVKSLIRGFADNLSRGAGRVSRSLQTATPVISKVVPALEGEAAGSQ